MLPATLSRPKGQIPDAKLTITKSKQWNIGNARCLQNDVNVPLYMSNK